MKNLKIAFSVLLAVLLIASCTQVRFVEMIPNDGDKKETPISDLPKIVDPETILKDAASRVEGLSYKIESSSEAFASRAAGDAESVYYQMVVSFRGYESANGIISRGTLTFNFKPIKDGYEYTANGNGLVVASSADASTRRTDAEGLAGSVKGFSFEDNGTVSVTTEFDVDVDPYKGSFTSGRETISIAEEYGLISGGNGTENNPYLVSTADEFISMVNFPDGTYFQLANDIDLPPETYIEKIVSFNLDGAGHNIVIDGVYDSGLTEWAEYCVFRYIGNGSFSNLNYYPSGLKSLTAEIRSNVTFTFDNVDTYGSMSGADTNVGPYTIYIGVNSNTTFIDCDNHADIIDEEGGDHYGSAFIGGYVYESNGQGPESIRFINCNNYGDLFFGNWAGMFIGNPNNLESIGNGDTARPEFVTIENCHNYGQIAAINDVGVITCDDSENAAERVGGEFVVFGNNTLTVYDDGTFETDVEGSILEYRVRANSVYEEGNRKHVFSVDMTNTDNKFPLKATNEGSHEMGDVFYDETEQIWKVFVDTSAYEEFETFVKFDNLWFYVIQYDAKGSIVASATANTITNR